MRLFYHPEITKVSLAGVLYALGDPVRLEIVKRLADQEELPCAALCIPIAKSTLSHHFKILRDAGVLHCRKEGTQHINSLRRQELDDRFPGLLDAVLECSEADESDC
ncbi:MAG: helix-turn-helix transcriptional regulator [Candidatus Parcubacteria bacterium]|uniref:ArsR/SmtB family transcription factor n=1 Tax=Phormidesmis priestleyi TaxID=268141 RepID=UPI000839E0F9|nr:metalloregulator ArsR/SmtB family transcription factor [Phormidesmis priestleyi]MBC7822593.1 helix-turn-helix transcriptional regulator [Leptolyngbyaceae cyanobacterium LF-bin-113]